ncbi:serine protease inhibitor Kazal-type 1-like isoform X1 [Monodelphis domestica]|uniref:Serine protease inhibitor Kazal-type 1-like n=1 Tax=Monodelphis domestica TaxID=13616 RepID=K7E474_MONDO|nr:serine protease inhibitor Kazal-type 1-like isoform X1 [Monodelphis domestica]
MRILAIFLLLSMALCCFMDTVQAKKFPQKAKCHSKIFGCPKIYYPVCGNDGRTYDNRCILCMENMNRKVQVLIQKYGECQGSKISWRPQ